MMITEHVLVFEIICNSTRERVGRGRAKFGSNPTILTLLSKGEGGGGQLRWKKRCNFINSIQSSSTLYVKTLLFSS